MKFLDYFCAFQDLLVTFNTDLKVGGEEGALTNAPPPPPPPPGPPQRKEYFVKLAVWLVVVVGITVAMDFLSCFSAFLGMLVYYYYF